MKKTLSLLLALCLMLGVFAAGTAWADDAAKAEEGEKPVVYFTDDISPEGLVAIYQALDWKPVGPVAVKLSTGEPPNSNYLRPELIADLVHLVDGTIVECNTAYAGLRSATAEHYQVAEDHGYTKIADFQILDEYGTMEIPVTGGKRLTSDLVGEHFKDYGSYLILSHFKGHAMAGYGGAIKNTSLGLRDKVQAGLVQRHRVGGGQDADVVDVGFFGIAVAVAVNGNPVHDVDEDHLITQIVADTLGGFCHGFQELKMQLVMPVCVAGAAGMNAHFPH